MFTGGLVMFAFLGAQLGCGAEPPRSTSTETPPAFDVQAQTGEALFKGVFFGVGDVGRHLDGIWKGKTLSESIQSTDATTLRNGAAELRKLGDSGKSAAEIDQVAGALSGESGPTIAAEIKQAAQAIDYDAIVASIAANDPTFFARFRTEIRSGNQLRVTAIFKEGQERIRSAFEAENTAAFGAGNSLAPKWCELCYVDIAAFAFAVVAVAAFWVVAAAAPTGDASTLQNQMTVQYLTEQLAS
jgi:SdpC family antimicrobial peptide